MLKNRIIPCLLIENDKLVKTVNFKNPKYVGDYLNAIKIFNEKEVDELIVLDINASKNKQGPNFKVIEKFASECFMPVSYGGGITSLEQVKKIFKLGIEKICIQSAALDNPNLIKELSNYFGSQSIILSLDIKKNIFGKYKIFRSDTKKTLDDSWIELLKKYIDMGIGEILLNSVDNDGSMNGMDLKLINEASKISKVPLVYMGGVGKIQDIKNAIKSGADSVAAGSFFIFYGSHKAVLISYPKDKFYDELDQK